MISLALSFASNALQYLQDYFLIELASSVVRDKGVIKFTSNFIVSLIIIITKSIPTY